MSKQEGNVFLKGAAILAVAGLFTKILGATFRLPLTDLLGAGTMGYYGVAYSVYGALVVMSTAGLPIAISRMVSEHRGMGEYKYAHKVFQVALVVMLAMGLVSFAICFFGADLICGFIGNEGAALGLRAIAPALIFVPLFSSFRGYFNGRQHMLPTAMSEMTEQLVRVIVGLTLAYMLKPVGGPEAAAGASFGASAGAVAGLLIIAIIYFVQRGALMDEIKSGSDRVDESAVIAKRLLIIAIPIIIGSEMMPLMNLIDTGMIMRELQAVGWTLEESKYKFGLISSYCSPLIALPWIVTQSVGVSLVPAVSRAFGKGDVDDAHKHIRMGYRTTMILGMPCAFGMMVLALPILKLLFASRPDECADAAPILMVMAFSIVLSSNMQASTSVLQAIGKQMIPVRNLFIGCVGKFIVAYILLRIHSINIIGAAIGTITAYLIAMVLNEMAVRKYTGVKVDYMTTYVRPFIATLIMSASAVGTYKLMSLVLDVNSGRAGNALATMTAVLVAIVVYVVATFAVKAITVEDLADFPHGDKLQKIIKKFIK